jgi:hypothetical protein
MRTQSLIAFSALLALVACGSGSTDSTSEASIDVTGPVQGVEAVHRLASGLTQALRPSAPLGIYVSAYLAQGVFIPVHSAVSGIEAARKLLSGQGATADETFSLLQALGNILQIDVPDVLNRSTDRRKALDDYLQSIHNVFVLSERKIAELETSVGTLEEEERSKRKAAQEIQRDIEKAMENEDYTAVGSRQRELADAESALAAITSKREQTSDVHQRFEELLDIAKKRIIAIESNRVIIIAGLKVVELPGIEDLNILLEKGAAARNKRSISTFGTEDL